MILEHEAFRIFPGDDYYSSNVQTNTFIYAFKL